MNNRKSFELALHELECIAPYMYEYFIGAADGLTYASAEAVRVVDEFTAKLSKKLSTLSLSLGVGRHKVKVPGNQKEYWKTCMRKTETLTGYRFFYMTICKGNTISYFENTIFVYEYIENLLHQVVKAAFDINASMITIMEGDKMHTECAEMKLLCNYFCYVNLLRRSMRIIAKKFKSVLEK